MATIKSHPSLLLSILILFICRTLAISQTLFPRARTCDNVPGHKAGTPLHRRSVLHSTLDLASSITASSFGPSFAQLLGRDPTRPRLPPPGPAPSECAASSSQACPNSHLWCAESGSTWILTTFVLTQPVSQPAISSILARALAQILLHIRQAHDGPIQQGSYDYVQPPTDGGNEYSSLQVGAESPDPWMPGPKPFPQPRTPHGLTLTAMNANNHQLTWGVLAAAIQALLTLMGAQHWWGAATSTVYDGDNAVGELDLEVGNPPESGQVGGSGTGDWPEISSTDSDDQGASSSGGHG
ncbi:MAG: hypothetical protein FRX48_07776 [Lasallia pustulata]|uniref:Uncharacterized protein n=1 Tax=Lasallia pustulata TaxID=136370 RepID=A0A5M8PIU6_9LECA|nr:MAG: hypothetical protein FRX48_07776 [Lasallia pustulata]